MIHITRKRAFICIGAAIGLMAASFMPAKAQTEATYYGSALEGNPTASGEPFRANGLTAAHPFLPFGTLLNVTHEGRSVTVRVNDRPDDKTQLDLSEGAARNIGLVDEGRGSVQVSKVDSPTTEAPEAPKEKPKELPKTGGIGQ